MKSMNKVSGNGLGRRISALIGVTALSIASSVSLAAIVDSGTVSIPVQNTIDGVYVNVVTRVTGATGAATPGWDLNPYGVAAGINFFWPAAPNGGCVVAVAAGPCSALVAGATVGPASIYQAGVAAGTNFRTAGTRNVGFRFLNEVTGVVNYGYATLTTSDPIGFPATIIQYVYDNAGIAITIGGAGADLSPNLAYNPVSGGAITLVAAGANATGNIVITPSGGTGAATTTVASCVFAANTASLASSPATLTFTGPTTTAQNLGLTCVRQAAAVTALLTCQETQSDGTPAGAQPRTFNVTCPTAVAADVSPDIAFTPNPLTLTGTGAATGTLTGTPSGGTGAATTTATCVDDAGGPAFSITPAARTFTGTTTTAQTYAIGCTTAAAAASGTITCSQVQSDGTNPAATLVTVNCPATVVGPGPEFSSAPPAGTSVSLNGTQGGPAATSLITVSNIEPGTTLTVTPSGLSGSLSITPAGTSSIAGGASQAFTVSCSTATIGTFNQTLTLTTNDPDDAETTVTFPVTCSIIAGGAGTQATAVPTLSPAGKLIAIFSMLGLGLLGFAVTRRA